MNYLHLVKESRETVKDDFCRICDEAHTEQLCRAVESLQEERDQMEGCTLLCAAMRARFYLRPTGDGSIANTRALAILQKAIFLVGEPNTHIGTIMQTYLMSAVAELTSQHGYTACCASALEVIQHAIDWGETELDTEGLY